MEGKVCEIDHFGRRILESPCVEEATMNAKRIAAVSLFAWALAAGPAGATIAIREADLTCDQLGADKVLISRDWSYIEPRVVCGTMYGVYYEQRMTIPGGSSQMALTDTVYPPGEKDLWFGFSCDDGYLIFFAGSCAC
jgi:hypothetical protein